MYTIKFISLMYFKKVDVKCLGISLHFDSFWPALPTNTYGFLWEVDAFEVAVS